MERNNKKYDDITRPLFDAALNEYNSDIKRSRSIDARVGIFLTFLITGFPIYVQIIGLQNLHTLLHTSYLPLDNCLQIIGFFASITVFMLAIIFAILTLSPRTFKIFSSKVSDINLIQWENSDVTINDMTLTVLNNIQEAVQHNRVVVAKKAKLFQFALWTLFTFVALMLFTFIMIII